MRRLRYNVAMSLDGFIAGPRGEYDWITPDSGIDFAALYRQFGTLLMGRLTYDAMRAKGMSAKGMGMKAFVVSTTLKPEQHPDVTIIASDVSMPSPLSRPRRAQFRIKTSGSAAEAHSFVACSMPAWSIPLKSPYSRYCWAAAFRCFPWADAARCILKRAKHCRAAS